MSYSTLLRLVDEKLDELKDRGVEPGTVVALAGDFSPNTIALLLALIEKSCVVVPLTRLTHERRSRLFELALVRCAFSIDDLDVVRFDDSFPGGSHEIFTSLKRSGHPGLVLFTSGTSGVPKAVVHDFLGLLNKFRARRRALRTLNFLLFDHWGGLNTMFHILSNGGMVVTTRERSPDAVCSLIEKRKIELLPASPTFLNLLLISEAYKRFDLSSLKVISYGTEPMPLHTLQRLQALFPAVSFQQTYGLIELGVLRSKSQSNSSLWVKIGG
ncbi:MAG: AMP-binding protein, partial [Bacteroidota bacterium]